MVPTLENFLPLRRGSAEGPASRMDLLETNELADAVVDVHDEIADLQIAKVREEGLREVALFRRAAFLLEDVGLGIDLERRFALA